MTILVRICFCFYVALVRFQYQHFFKVLFKGLLLLHSIFCAVNFHHIVLLLTVKIPQTLQYLAKQLFYIIWMSEISIGSLLLNSKLTLIVKRLYWSSCLYWSFLLAEASVTTLSNYLICLICPPPLWWGRWLHKINCFLYCNRVVMF